MTPVQVVRNIITIFNPPDETRPSEQLKNIVRVSIAENLIDEHNQT